MTSLTRIHRCCKWQMINCLGMLSIRNFIERPKERNICGRPRESWASRPYVGLGASVPGWNTSQWPQHQPGGLQTRARWVHRSHGTASSPFMGGPPSGPKRGGRGSGKANRYVEVIRTHPGFTTNIRSQTDEASSWYSWWQSGSEYAKLDKDYIWPMGSGDSGRLPDRLGVNPSAGPEVFHSEILRNRMPQSGLGNSQNAGQKCHNNLIGGTGSICRPSLPEAEQRWVTTTSIQSETPEQVCSVRTFQNGGAAHGFGLGAGGVLDDKSRSRGCIFLSENCSERPEVSDVSLKGQSVSVQVMPFGLASAPRSFTKLLKPAISSW